MTFEEMERKIRDLLQRALGAGGFDAATDIEAITINRWSHGYSLEYMRPWDSYWPQARCRSRPPAKAGAASPSPMPTPAPMPMRTRRSTRPAAPSTN